MNIDSKYQAMVEKLQRIKTRDDPTQSRVDVISFLRDIHTLILHVNDYKQLSLFSLDESMIFSTNRNLYSRSNPDMQIQSKGLFAEVLSLAHINNSKEVSENTSYALDILHSALSRNASSKGKVREKALNIIEDCITEIESW